MYLWSRLNPSVRLSLFGVMQITAPYLPYALVVFSWALSSSWNAVVGDLLGITVGHIWYFFNHVWDKELASGRRNWLRTPRLLWVHSLDVMWCNGRRSALWLTHGHAMLWVRCHPIRWRAQRADTRRTREAA